MNKYVISDFFAAMRWSNVKKVLKTSMIGYWIFLAVVWGINLTRDAKIDKSEDLVKISVSGGIYITDKLIVFLCAMLVAFALSIVNSVTMIKLPKSMYLVPSSEDERRSYLRNIWRCKMIFSMFLSLLLILGIRLCGMVTWKFVPALCIFAFSISTNLTVTHNPGGILKGNNQKYYQDDFRKSWVSDERLKGLDILNGTSIILSAIGLLIGLWKIDLYGADEVGILFAIAVYLIAITNLVIAFFVRKYVKIIIEKSLDYEVSCEIERFFER